MSIKFRWLGNICLEIVLPSGKVLVVDPWLENNPHSPIKSGDITGADYVAITHGHHDHFADAGPLVHKFKSTVICSRWIAEPLARFINIDPDTVVKVTSGDRIQFDDLTVEVKKADHVSTVAPLKETYQRLKGSPPPPDMPIPEIRKAISEISPTRRQEPSAEQQALQKRVRDAGITIGEQLSYVFETRDNLRLYVHGAGPYDYLRQVIRDSHPHVFFSQLGGVKSETAAEIAALSGAEIVVPIHHDMDGIEVAHKRAQSMAAQMALVSKARLLDVVHGKWYEIGLRASEVP
jgi:L-ascorbate metabolism protein UlaG (beta-lactamase superfamily)